MMTGINVINRLKNYAMLFLTVLLLTFCILPISAWASEETESAETTVKNGLVTENGTLHYYKNGELVKDKLGIKIGKKYYKISKKGVVTKVSEAAGRAGIQLEKIGRSSSKSKTLKKAFTWCSTKIAYRASCGSPSSGQSAAAYYSIYGFKKKRGDCNVMAATFYQMAKALGYNAKFVTGLIVSGTDSNGNAVYSSHAWVTIKISGKTYVYDPNFAYVYHTRTNNTQAHSGYKMTYTKTGSKLQYKYYSKNKTLYK